MPSTLSTSPTSSNGIAAGPVHLVHEGEDRDLALLADAEELLGLRLDALGAVEEHDRAVDGVERAVGVLAEVGVARACRAGSSAARDTGTAARWW